jgi:hypothetical protein
MPLIRITPVNTATGKRAGEDYGLRIYDAHVDKDGYLQLFTVLENEEPRAIHLIRHDIPLMETAFSIFGVATSIRSARGLMEELATLARKQKWVGRAGAVGIAFASAGALYEFLQTRPFDKEGYYYANGGLFLGRKIHTGNSEDYAP